MWIFLNNAFLSIVDTRPETSKRRGNLPNDPLTVRARFKGDIERVFPTARVTHTPDRDYAYRAFINRGTVAGVIAGSVHGLTAHNFKASVREKWRHDAYLNVWRVMEREQRRQHPMDPDPMLDLDLETPSPHTTRETGSSTSRGRTTRGQRTTARKPPARPA